MKILTCHTFYRERSGEDNVYCSEVDLLQRRGHDVIEFNLDNSELDSQSLVKVGLNSLWNRRVYKELSQIIKSTKPDVMHVYNMLPQLSPSSLFAARELGVPIVRSIHNFRLVCANATLYRDGNICTECVGRFIPAPAIRYACYRNSRLATSSVVINQVLDRALNREDKCVARYLVGGTKSSIKPLLKGGVPVEKIILKPNFLEPDPGPGEGGNGALFVGRFSDQKGIRVVLDAWLRGNIKIPLTIVGFGPLEDLVKKAESKNKWIRWIGALDQSQLHTLMKKSDFLIFPSVWFEAMPRTIIESFACGTPVIASDIGAMQDMVDDRKTGLKFKAGDFSALARTVAEFMSAKDDWGAMRKASRQTFLETYTPEISYRAMIDTYRQAINSPLT